MTDIQFYTQPQSRGRTVRWLLEELGQPYDTHVLDYATTMKTAEFLKINPMGKVPALVHKGRIVTETAAICTYLADAFPEAGLLPVPEARADYYRWIFFVNSPIEASFMDKVRGIEMASEQAMMLGYRPFGETLKILTDFLDGRSYIAGDRFSAADCFVGSFVAFIMKMGFAANPVMETYWQGLASRPAFVKASAIDDALLEAAS